MQVRILYGKILFCQIKNKKSISFCEKYFDKNKEMNIFISNIQRNLVGDKRREHTPYKQGVGGSNPSSPTI